MKKLYTPFSLCFPEKQEIYTWFSHILEKDIYYYPLVSGGPDSMLMIHCLFDYFFTMGRDVSTIYPLYVHHKQRQEADDEAAFLSDYFYYYNIAILSLGSVKKGLSEHILRKKRWEVIHEYIQNTHSGHIITGHNLSDRVETSFLHLMRGSNLPGITNMKKDDIYSHERTTYRVLRPLLSLPKTSIEHLCQEQDIPFFIDRTNDDPSVSTRNEIRNYISTTLAQYHLSDMYRQAMANMYMDIDMHTEKISATYIALQPSMYWSVSAYYRTSLPTTLTQTYALFSHFGLVSGISKRTLGEFSNFFVTKQSGRKYLHGRYFIIAHGMLYCFCRSYTGAFRESGSDENILITDIGVYTLGDFTWNITNKDYIGASLQYPNSTSRWQGKNMTKRLLNKKIPVFWRKYYPIIVRDHQVLDVLDPSSLVGYI